MVTIGYIETEQHTVYCWNRVTVVGIDVLAVIQKIKLKKGEFIESVTRLHEISYL